MTSQGHGRALAAPGCVRAVLTSAVPAVQRAAALAPPRAEALAPPRAEALAPPWAGITGQVHAQCAKSSLIRKYLLV